MPTKRDCQRILDAILENNGIGWTERFDDICKLMNERADQGDTGFGQLRLAISTCPTGTGPDSHAYRGAVGDYIRKMAETGDHSTALRVAQGTARVLTSKDLMTSRHHPVGSTLRKVGAMLNAPVASSHSNKGSGK